MAAGIFGGLALAVILVSAFTAWRHPHLRRMAVRNLTVRKSTTVFTMVGAMTGTTLITASLLLSGSLQASADRFFEEQFGRIVSDIPAGEQKGLNGPHLTAEDVRNIERLAKKENYDAVLSTAGLTATLIKPDDSGKPLLLSPKTYVYGFDPEEAKWFDADAMRDVPADLGEGEIVLSKRTADRLEVKAGDRVVVLDVENREHPFTVKKVVAERGLSGYRGTEKARTTAMVSLDTARALAGVESGGYTNVLLARSSDRLDGVFGVSEGVRMFKFELAGWRVINVREMAAHELDNLFRLIPVFTIASVNAILIGWALIVNLFKMLAEERRQEWGILRAIGMNRRDLSRLLRMEGLLYAGGSALVGMAAGTGLSWLLLLQMKEVFSLAAEYDSQLTIRFAFFVDPASLLTGFAIGVLIVHLCVAFIARRAAGLSIVQALRREGGRDRKMVTRRRSTARTAGALLLTALTVSAFLITSTEGFREKVSDTSIEPFIIFAVGFLLVTMSILSIIATMPHLFSGLGRLFRPFPRLFGALTLAFRYPEVNRVRTGLLFLMFVLVLFLTSFSGVFAASFAGFFGDFNARKATGGYDLTATAGRKLSTSELENILRSSEFVDPGHIGVAVAVPQMVSVETVNGVDTRYAETNGVRLVKRDSRLADDRAVWKEIADNPDVAVVDESLLDWAWDEGYVPREKPLTVGDDYPIVVENRIAARKKIIGIAKSEKESYGYPASGGIWVKASEIGKLARDERNIRTTLLIRARSEDVLKPLHEGAEKALNLNNLFGLRNPRDEFLISNLFLRTFFSLFEGFSALATVIGIAGMMVVMFRVVQERRREIGMLHAIGIPPKSIFRSILAEGALIAWTGIAVGMGIGCYSGYLMIRAFSPEGSVSVLFPYGKLALYFGGAFLLTLLCAVIPARKALRLSPVEATRYVG